MRQGRSAATLFVISAPPTGRMRADCRHPPSPISHLPSPIPPSPFGMRLGSEGIAETRPDCAADGVPFDADLRLAGNDELRF